MTRTRDLPPDRAFALTIAGIPSGRKHRAGSLAVRTARAVAPVRTGRLRRSIGYRVDGAGAVRLYAGAPYAEHVEPLRPFLGPGAKAATDRYGGTVTGNP